MKRILRHVGGKDFRKTHQKKLDEQKKVLSEKIKVEEEKKKIEEEAKQFKSHWRNELPLEKREKEITESKKFFSSWKKQLFEGMTTSDIFQTTINAADSPLTTLDVSDSASFNNDNGGPNLGSDNDGLSGCTIVSNGTGSGSDGGFNVGQSYLAFNQTAWEDGDVEGTQNMRFAVMAPMDASRATTLEVTAIVGNGSNGGDAPESTEDIKLAYANGEGAYEFVNDENGNQIVVVPYNGSGSLQTYSVTIPIAYRLSNISFILMSRQDTMSDPSAERLQDNYGITEIKLKRTTPISLFVSLDSPEATHFIRASTPQNRGLTAEQRRKKLEDMLIAGNEYMLKQLGLQGSQARPADTGKTLSWQQAASLRGPETPTTGFGSPTLGRIGTPAISDVATPSFTPIYNTSQANQEWQKSLRAAGYSEDEIARITNVNYAPMSASRESKRQQLERQKAEREARAEEERLRQEIEFQQMYAHNMRMRQPETTTKTEYRPSQEYLRRVEIENRLREIQNAEAQAWKQKVAQWERGGMKGPAPKLKYTTISDLDKPTPTGSDTGWQPIPQSDKQVADKVSDKPLTIDDFESAADYSAFKAGGGNAAMKEKGQTRQQVIDQGKINLGQYDQDPRISKGMADALDVKNSNNLSDKIMRFFGDVGDLVQGKVINSLDYNSQLAIQLSKSIISGSPQEITLGSGAKKDQINSVDPNALEKILQIRKPPTPDANNAVNPTPGMKSDKVLQGDWGAQGGSEFSYDPATDTFTITSNKMLRTGQSGDQFDITQGGQVSGGQVVDRGKQTAFGDIPDADPKVVDQKAKEFINHPAVRGFLNAVGITAGIVQKSDGINLYQQLKNDPDEYEKFENNVAKAANDIARSGVQGTASNIVGIRKALTDLGFPKSEIENMDAGYGQVYSQTSYKGNEIPPEIRAVINNKIGTRSESFKIKVISEKRKLKSPKEVVNKIPGYYDGKPAPLGFPDDPPPTPVNGFHPDLIDGKKVADRFNRLDPQSARAMPLTGNPHIDNKVRAAAKKPK